MHSKGVVGLSIITLLLCTYHNAVECAGQALNYGEALTKSLLYFQSQRSGKLPSNQRVQWRGDSALRDGQGDAVDLVGGYYDAGDNVKFNFPMAYTVTMLVWGVFEAKFEAANELGNAIDAIKWGTDYLLKTTCSTPESECWERPEDMNTPRTPFKIDEAHPGSDLAAETAAAFAVASILFEFAEGHKGKYSDSIPAAAKFYSSTWLHRASNDRKYKDLLAYSASLGGTILSLQGLEQKQGNWAGYIDHVEEFICNCMQKGNCNVFMTPGGLIWFSEWANLQYTTSSLLAMIVYSDYLTQSRSNLNCPHEPVNPNQILDFAKSRVDYMLGKNPNGMS
ncbi:LOW QUALITY PROTEIN: hypothetical protein V2J09_024233 [Rumex salicifolius]